jgi:hypothetical protein
MTVRALTIAAAIGQGARPGSRRDPDSLEHAVNLFFT